METNPLSVVLTRGHALIATAKVKGKPLKLSRKKLIALNKRRNGIIRDYCFGKQYHSKILFEIKIV